MNKPHHLFFLLGLTSMVSQILLMRELVVVFYGNELSLGIMLGSWLFWVGMGSVLAGLILTRLPALSRSLIIALIQAALGLFPLATLLSVRSLPSFLQHAVVGEVVGYLPIAIFSFTVIAPLCLLFGFLFTLFCHVWADRDSASSINSVYFIEGMGAAAGGIMFALLLAKFVDPVDTALLLLVLNVAAGVSILSRRRMLSLVSALALIAVLSAGGAFFGVAATVKQQSLSRLWRGLQVVHSENSMYGNVTFVENEEQKSLYENGLLIDSYPDQFSAEESVHFALLEQPAPKSVLLIGGAGSGSLAEALKHPVERIDYVEIDPLIIQLLRKNFPSEVTDPLDDQRVKIHNTDGRLFLKQTAEYYDVIIVNLPDPYTAQVNRFYTKEFFQLCRSRMTSAGVLSFRVSSSETYISPELQHFIGCIYRTLSDVFPDVKVIPGENNVFLASPTQGILSVDADILLERLTERKLKDKVLFIREYYLPFRLSEGHRQLLSEALLAEDGARRNTDFSPVCYYYDAVLWSKQFKDWSSRFLQFFARLSPILLLTILGGLFAVALLAQILFRRSRRRQAILLAVGATGFTQIAMEMVILIAFQALYGYVYHKLAIIISCFMVGLALGAFLIGRMENLNQPRKGVFLTVQGMVSLYPILLLGALSLMAQSESSSASLFYAGAAFPGLAFLAGIVGGLQFPLANALWLVEKPGVARAAGYTYGIDLMGSCLGAFLTTALLIPLFGIPFTCITAAVITGGSLILLAQGFSRPLE